MVTIFTLDELKEIRKKYIIRDFRTLEARKKDGSVTLPENLSQEERNKIISAIYLYRVIRDVQSNAFQSKKSEEEILHEIQSNFPQQALSDKPKSVSGFVMMGGRPIDTIICDLAKPEGNMNYMAETYLQYTLAEKGKKAVNIQRSIQGGMAYDVSYDIEELEKENEFIKSLDPNNPMYTQPPKMKTLTPEQKARRRTFVEECISNYNKIEKDEWYQHRVEKEAINMQKVANIVNNHETMSPVKNGPGLLRLLKAAQNLSIDGEKDFLEEIISQPAVNKALLELRRSGQADKMRDEAMKNESNGMINSYGLLKEHQPTQGEKELRSANTCVRHNPNAVSEAKKTMQNSSTLLFDTNTDGIRLSNLYSLIARTQGKIPSKTRTAGNIVLDTDTEKSR